MIAISGTVLEERLLRSGGGCGGGVGGEGGLAQAEAKAKAGCSETPMFLSHGLRGLCIFFSLVCVSHVYRMCIVCVCVYIVCVTVCCVYHVYNGHVYIM